MRGKNERFAKLVNMDENGTEEEKVTARKKISIYVNRYGFTRKDIRNEKKTVFDQMFCHSTNGEILEYVNHLEKAKMIAAFIEDNEFSVQAFLDDYNHSGLVHMVNAWLESKR
ncbi:MAG: hypothetical protein MR936_05845 [Eubacterium sp.]|nr:hypothetical protein [Eubacterium sp.]